MNPELDDLLKAFDVFKQAPPADQKRLLTLYQLRLDDIIERFPNLSRSSLDAAVRWRYPQWLKAQAGPTPIPPKA